MPSIINADTTSGVIITSDTSGEIKLQSAGTDIATVSSTGITMASGKSVSGGEIIQNAGPAFSAYQSSAQTIAGYTFVKMNLQTEEFDTDNCFDSTTNYRFTPTVAGYYQVNGLCRFNAVVDSPQCTINKNGTGFKVGNNPERGVWSSVSALIYMNGTTDYLEFFFAHTSATNQTLLANFIGNYFQAALVRKA